MGLTANIYYSNIINGMISPIPTISACRIKNKYFYIQIHNIEEVLLFLFFFAVLLSSGRPEVHKLYKVTWATILKETNASE